MSDHDDVSEERPAAPKEARRWLRQARHDLSDATYAAQGGRHALACFLAHQVAEKAVSAFLFARGAEQIWGHALADLCEDALTFDPAFELIRSQALPLDKHYLASRYPSALPGGVPAEAYGPADSEAALAQARDVVAFVEARI